MPSPLIPQPPLTKGARAAIKHNVKELCAVVLASRRQTAPRTLSRLSGHCVPRTIYIILNAHNRHVAALMRAASHAKLFINRCAHPRPAPPSTPKGFPKKG
jgi:hypothetical protein